MDARVGRNWRKSQTELVLLGGARRPAAEVGHRPAAHVQGGRRPSPGSVRLLVVAGDREPASLRDPGWPCGVIYCRS